LFPIVPEFYKAAAANKAAPIKPNPIPTFSLAPVVAEGVAAVPAAVELDASVTVVALELAVDEAELSELAEAEEEEDAEDAEDADVTEAVDSEDEDEEAEVAVAPVPVELRTPERREPTDPSATQVPATDLVISYAPTIPVSQQNPFPSYPIHKLQEESAHLGEPSTSPRQSLAFSVSVKLNIWGSENKQLEQQAATS